MGVLCIGWGAAALVSAVAGTGIRSGCCRRRMGLGLVAAGYGWAARTAHRPARTAKPLIRKVPEVPAILRHRRSRGPVV